jgi:hypothetical protein
MVGDRNNTQVKPRRGGHDRLVNAERNPARRRLERLLFLADRVDEVASGPANGPREMPGRRGPAIANDLGGSEEVTLPDASSGIARSGGSHPVGRSVCFCRSSKVNG